MTNRRPTTSSSGPAAIRVYGAEDCLASVEVGEPPAGPLWVTPAGRCWRLDHAMPAPYGNQAACWDGVQRSGLRQKSATVYRRPAPTVYPDLGLAAVYYSARMMVSQKTELLAIALDTNSMPYGRLKIETLREVHRLAVRHGLEVWLPEPVLWEWQEHAERIRAEARAELRKRSTLLKAAGVVMPEVPSSDEVREQIQSAVLGLGLPLKLLPLSGTIAEQALRDQIMCLPPGARINVRSGDEAELNPNPRAQKNKAERFVKTGGSDSAILRLILEAASREARSFVIFGGDKDLARAAEAWGLPEMQSISSLVDLTGFLSDAMPTRTPLPPLDYQSAADRYELISAIRYSSLGNLVPEQESVQGFEDWPADEPPADLLDLTVSVLEIDEVFGLRSVASVGDGELSARLFMLATVNISAIGSNIDKPGGVESFNLLQSGVLVVSPVLIRRQGAEIIAVSDGAASVRAPRTHFWLPEDAFGEVVGALATCPGLEDLEFLGKFEGGVAIVRDISAKLRVTLRMSGSAVSAWSLVVIVSNSGRENSEHTISCTYDAKSYVSGPRHGFHLYPPWRLAIGGGDPAWLAAAWLSSELEMAMIEPGVVIHSVDEGMH